MKKEFIVNRQGRDFVLYAGLLDQAHREGLKRISTTLLQAPSDANGQLAICYAEVETEKGIFGGIGDASPQNVGRMIAMHTVRMSETRAKARALRDAINVGVTALEELADSEETSELTIMQAAQPRPGQASRAPRQIAAVPPPDLDGDGQEAEAPSALQAKARSVGDDARGEASQRAEGTGPATAQQIDRLVKLQAALGRPKQAPEGLSFEEAAHQIIELVRIFNAQARGGRQSQAR